jgi:DNA-binding CsgD family transcriptional regulator
MIDDNQQDIKKQLSKWAILLCIIVFSLILLDIVGDYQDGIALNHIVIELLILFASIVGIVYFGWFYFQLTQSRISHLKLDLAAAHQQARQWQDANRDLVAGLSKQILKQFDQWELTKSETEVGMLILKGLSHQQIADIRETSERTIRDQARAVYRKSGLAGRSELSAFFIEDLLPPHVDD